MYIDKKSPIPVYYQLKIIILDKIKSGEYGVGSLIPSERDLGDLLGISRMTVRQALNQLVNEGVLSREKGKGTFVTKSKLEQRNVMSFSDLVRQRGLTPNTKVLSFTKGYYDPAISDCLDLKGGEALYNIKRQRLAENSPVGIEEVYIPEKFCPNLDERDLSGSLYKLLRDKFLHNISYVDSIIESAKPSREEKELLEIGGNTSVLCISNIYYIESGVKLLFERSVYRSDEYKYNVRVYVDKNME